MTLSFTKLRALTLNDQAVSKSPTPSEKVASITKPTTTPTIQPITEQHYSWSITSNLNSEAHKRNANQKIICAKIRTNE